MMETESAENLQNLETPCLLLEVERMQKNIREMKARLGRLGVRLRTHMKTAKSVEIAPLLLDETNSAITVSTLKEAEEFARIGVTDMIYAVGISPQKLERVGRLRRSGIKLKVILDSTAQADALAAYARETGDAVEAMIEIDCDGHRSGVRPDDREKLLAIAEILKNGGAPLAGVLTHAGDSYNARNLAEMRAAAEQERNSVVGAAGILRAAGHDCPVVSVGSTPTAHFAEDLTGVTEVRAGVFVFGDLVMNGIGVCTTDDIAISVLTSVIGHQAEKGWIICDAGWMAMSRDRGTAQQPVDQGYGLVCDAAGAVIEGLTMTAANQEHGIITSGNGAQNLSAAYPIGTLLRVLPNHACATAAQFQEYQVIENGRYQGRWSRFNGW